MKPAINSGFDKFKDKFYVSYEDDTEQYLHSDGVWRYSTKYEGEYTGYFNSREEAQAVLDTYLKGETK